MSARFPDFGLARDVYEDLKYESQNRNLPWRWMAPEAIRDNSFTTEADVWSYGVTFWEIMSLAASPYPGVDDHKLLPYLEGGERLSCPLGCSSAVFDLMLACWNTFPELRPSFEDIIASIKDLNVGESHYETIGSGAKYMTVDPSMDDPAISGYETPNSWNTDMYDVNQKGPGAWNSDMYDIAKKGGKASKKAWSDPQYATPADGEYQANYDASVVGATSNNYEVAMSGPHYEVASKGKKVVAKVAGFSAAEESTDDGMYELASGSNVHYDVAKPSGVDYELAQPSGVDYELAKPAEEYESVDYDLAQPSGIDYEVAPARHNTQYQKPKSSTAVHNPPQLDGWSDS